MSVEMKLSIFFKLNMAKSDVAIWQQWDVMHLATSTFYLHDVQVRCIFLAKFEPKSASLDN